MFLPQFIDPTMPALAQSLLVASIHFAQGGMVWLGGLAFMVHGARRYLARPVIARCLNGGVTGTILFGFGVKLAMFER